MGTIGDSPLSLSHSVRFQRITQHPFTYHNNINCIERRMAELLWRISLLLLLDGSPLLISSSLFLYAWSTTIPFAISLSPQVASATALQ